MFEKDDEGDEKNEMSVRLLIIFWRVGVSRKKERKMLPSLNDDDATADDDLRENSKGNAAAVAAPTITVVQSTASERA